MTVNQTADAPASVSRPPLGKIIRGGAVGHFVEWYDYGIYGLMVGAIAANLLPAAHGTDSLILAYAGFAISFVARPFGGLIMNMIGDRIGRRAILVTLILMMSAATVGIGLTPDFSMIGWFAPALLIVFRIAQGISAGGESPSANAYVAEYSPNTMRGLTTALLAVGSFTAVLVGTILSGFVTGLAESTGQEWLWRIPFLLAAPLGFIGFWIRSKLDESPAFEELKERGSTAKNPLKDAFASRAVRRAILIAIFLPLMNGSGYYILLVYMPTYLKANLGFTASEGFGITAISIAALLVCLPLLAHLSDRIGRKKVLFASAVGMLIAAYPCFQLAITGGFGGAVVGAIIMAIFFAGHAGVLQATLVELFPTRVRTTAMSVGFNISTAIFGGAAPLVMTALIGATGNVAIPAFYVILTALGTAITVLFIRETAGEPLQ